MVHVRRHVRRRASLAYRVRVTKADVEPYILELAGEARREAAHLPRGHEVAIGVTFDGTKTVITGSEQHVELDNPDYEYTLHTHPGGTPPSVKDVLSLWARKKQQASYIVTKRDIWAMRKTPAIEVKTARVWDMFKMYRRLEEEMLPWQEGGYARGYAESIGIEFLQLFSGG